MTWEYPFILITMATTPVDPEVIKAMIPYIETYYGNPSSAYSIGKSNKEALEKARAQVAKLINSGAEEICFTQLCHRIKQSGDKGSCHRQCQQGPAYYNLGN